MCIPSMVLSVYYSLKLFTVRVVSLSEELLLIICYYYYYLLFNYLISVLDVATVLEIGSVFYRSGASLLAL